MKNEQVKKKSLSPIVNSQERSDFISNSILEDIPSNQNYNCHDFNQAD